MSIRDPQPGDWNNHPTRDFAKEAEEIEKLHTKHDFQCSWCGAAPAALSPPGHSQTSTKVPMPSEPKEAKPADTLRRNIGMLRQWLNEDRIRDAKHFVTNEDLEHWLFWESRSNGEATALSDHQELK